MSSETFSTNIRRLDATTVNRIAAGEVIERPASVIKELLENAIDAGADRIEVVTAKGGKTLMRVTDNGMGMNRDDIALAIERHCTSKLSDDLMDIRHLGFRGEALPSIGSVSRLSITSRKRDDDTAWKISVTGGKVDGPMPAALSQGTVVEVSDLFHATPARLKFLKSDQAEANAITDVFKRTALAFPNVHFSISGSDRSTTNYTKADQTGRIEQVLGSEFKENCLEIDAEREGVTLGGLISVPTYHRGNSLQQYFYVNGRPVKDKALFGAIRGAYSDFLPGGRYPSLVLFIEIQPHLVDVNVHPAKADVRFRDPGLIRGLVVGALKQALSEGGPLTSRAGAEGMVSAFRAGTSAYYPKREGQSAARDWGKPLDPAFNYNTSPNGFAETQAKFETGIQPSGKVETRLSDDEQTFPLGTARAQVHGNYIVSQSDKGLVIVDQHAAHERIVYERLKQGMARGLPSQLLLVPEIVDLQEEDVNRVLAYRDDLTKLGLELEGFGPGAIAVRGTPALLGETDVKSLLQELAAEIAEWGSADTLKERLEHVAATMACHGSVRSGRILQADEMNALLRQMETTPNSGQCNHGRPTFIELDLKDIERLFGR